MASYENNQADRRVQSIGAMEAGVRFAGVYEIVRLLGEGGMGSVYLAHDLRSGGREVALKILHPGKVRPGLTLGDAGVTLGSFGGQSAEARFLASCEHPSILPVYDAGTDPATGLTYFTMRVCLLTRGEMAHLCDEVLRCPYPRDRARWDEGPSALTLRDLLKGGKAIPEAAVARIGIDIVEALAYTHERRPPLVHRDIKPSNILFDAAGRAILSDFGIAGEIFADGPASASGPGGASRGFAGTPAYAAPEQKGGEEATPASDYYSLGVVLHEALTGERILGSSAPSRFDPARISRMWDALLPRLLAEDPRERLSDPGEILRALQSILRRSARRSGHRAWLFAAAAAGALVVAAIAGFGIRHPGFASRSGPVGIRGSGIPAPESRTLSTEERAADVARRVSLLRSVPEWPVQGEPWFPSVLYPPRPENNRRHFGGTVWEMLLPDGTPMQFVSMALGVEERFIDYPHGFFIGDDGRPNMDKPERDAARTVVSRRLLFSRTEITREQFAAVMSATGPVPLRETTMSGWTNAAAAMEEMAMGPSEFNSRVRNFRKTHGDEFFSTACTSVFKRVTHKNPPPGGMPAAEGLRFADVERFVAKLNSLCPDGCVFRLPTEAEWEAMCRMTENRRFEGENLDEICWSRENSGGAPHPVATKEPGPFGVWDMHGNVAEWCVDGFAPLVRPAFDPVAPVGADGLRVVKGGSWADKAEDCGSECRRAAGPDETDIGIRLVLEY